MAIPSPFGVTEFANEKTRSHGTRPTLRVICFRKESTRLGNLAGRSRWLNTGRR